MAVLMHASLASHTTTRATECTYVMPACHLLGRYPCSPRQSLRKVYLFVCCGMQAIAALDRALLAPATAPLTPQPRCPAGAFPVRGVCEPCPAGWAVERAGWYTCDICPVGTYSSPARTACQPCEPSESTVLAGSTGSQSCMPVERADEMRAELNPLAEVVNKMAVPLAVGRPDETERKKLTWWEWTATGYDTQDEFNGLQITNRQWHAAQAHRLSTGSSRRRLTSDLVDCNPTVGGPDVYLPQPPPPPKPFNLTLVLNTTVCEEGCNENCSTFYCKCWARLPVDAFFCIAFSAQECP